jgi:hypothetical protein
MASASPVKRTVRLSDRLSIEIGMKNQRMDVCWVPAMPNRLSRRELARYRSARDAMIGELLRLNGLSSAAVVEA